MKAHKLMTIALLFIIGLNCTGQTPEQKKQIEEAQKLVAEMQRKQDSLMNTPEIKKKMKELEEMQAKQKAEWAKQNQNRKGVKSKTPTSTSHLDIYKITMSTAKKFDDWSDGAAELYVIKYLPLGKSPDTENKIGSIGTDGSFNFDMPESIVCKNKISDYLFKCRYVKSPTPTEYVNPNAGLEMRGISVVKNGMIIGRISLATSKEQANNNSPHAEYRGELGYRLEWWYAEEASSAVVRCDRTLDNYGTSLEITNVYDLQFQPGWNLLKTEILDAHSPKFYKTKKYSITAGLPQDVRWVYVAHQ